MSLLTAAPVLTRHSNGSDVCRASVFESYAELVGALDGDRAELTSAHTGCIRRMWPRRCFTATTAANQRQRTTRLFGNASVSWLS